MCPSLHQLSSSRYLLNKLGPFYNEVTLAQLAIDLDKKEHELMVEQGMTKDFLKFMQEDSGNVAMDGYYSIQVLQCNDMIMKRR